MFKYLFILRFGCIAIVAGLAFGMLTLGAANSWAQVEESVGFKNYTLYKLCEGEVDPWNQKIQGIGTVTYECDDEAGCNLVVDAIGICGNQDIRYTCNDGAVVTLLPSGVLLVPDDCEGTCGICPSV